MAWHSSSKAVAEARRDVARGAAETEHRVFFVRLVDARRRSACVYSLDLKSDRRTMTGFGQKAAAMVATPSASFSTIEVTRAGVAARHGARFRSRRSAGRCVDSPGWPSGCTPIMLLMTNSRRARPTPSFGSLREVESQLRVADVHHDLDRQLGHRADVQLGDLRNRAGRR